MFTNMFKEIESVWWGLARCCHSDKYISWSVKVDHKQPDVVTQAALPYLSYRSSCTRPALEALSSMVRLSGLPQRCSSTCTQSRAALQAASGARATNRLNLSRLYTMATLTGACFTPATVLPSTMSGKQRARTDKAANVVYT